MDFFDAYLPPLESPGAVYPQDYHLKTLNFLTSNGNKIELKRLLRELSYYEDIYNFCVSGYIKIEDSQGFVESLQLTGNEYLEINFGKVKDGKNRNDQIVRVYKVGDRTASENLNTQYYTMYFCSEELMLSEQVKVSKSYKGMKISDIVSDILDVNLKVQDDDVENIEETTGMYDFVIPRMKPFEAISWVSMYARPKATGTVGADMIFYQTRDGYNFRSLQSMIRGEVYGTYRYQQKNLDEQLQPIQDEVMTVLDYEFNKTYDVINDINSGTYSNKLISIDPLQRSFKSTDFNYDEFKDKVKSLNGKSVTNNMQNRFGKELYNQPEGVTKVATGNSEQGLNPYIKGKGAGFAKDIFIETYVPQRTAQLNLANYNVVKLAIPGDTGITAGKVIEFNLMSIKPTTNKRELDRYYSGKYLVTAVRHIIQPNNGTFQTILEIAKDSSKTQYQSVDNSDPDFKESVIA